MYKNRALLNGVHGMPAFSSCFRLTSVKFNIEEPQAILLKNCEFREKRLGESHTSLGGVNKCQSILSTFVV